MREVFSVAQLMQRDDERVMGQASGLRSRAVGRLESCAGAFDAMEVPVGAPVEALGCPSCKRLYGFGDVCPDCDIFLVSKSFLSEVEAEHVCRPSRLQQLSPMAVSIVASLMMAVAFFWFSLQL